MAKTALLPTVTAVRMAWAMTGKFSDDESKIIAAYVEDELKNVEGEASKIGPKEKSYVKSAVATIKASMRSLNIIYKSRELNFKENEKLREAYLKSITENLDFGKQASDFLRSLPAMVIGGAGGVTVADAVGLSGVMLWGVGLGLAGLGYLVQSYFVRRGRRQTQMLYVSQDYERNLYYEQYINRARDILQGLFLDLERIHKRIFGENYEVKIEPSAVKILVDAMLAGVTPTFCQFVHQHMKEKKVTPELWTKCECGNADAVRTCPFWEGPRESAPMGQ
jgi:hypothetical protein